MEWQNGDHCVRVDTQSCGSEVYTHNQLLYLGSCTSEAEGVGTGQSGQEHSPVVQLAG